MGTRVIAPSAVPKYLARKGSRNFNDGLAFIIPACFSPVLEWLFEIENQIVGGAMREAFSRGVFAKKFGNRLHFRGTYDRLRPSSIDSSESFLRKRGAV